MVRIVNFIRRRWILFIIFFLILSLPACYIVSQKEVLYKAEAKVAFVGKGSFFTPEIEAGKIREIGFLKKITDMVPQLDVSSLRNNLKLDFEKENILSISFTSANPITACAAANAASNIFLKERENIVEDLSRERKAELKVLSDQITTLKYNLNLSKRELRELKQQNAELDKRRVDLQSWLAGLDLQRSELLKIFTEKHPEVVNITNRIESVQSQLNTLPDNTPTYNGLASDVEGWELTLSLKQKEYDDLTEYLEGKSDLWQVELAERALLPDKPIGRPKRWYYRWVLLITFSTSLLWSIIMELADRRIYTSEEAQRYLDLPVIAEVDRVIFEKKTKFKGLGSGEKVIFNYSSNPQLLRRYEQLYTFLKLDVFKGDMEGKSVVITSAEPETGKTFIASNLALSAARSGEKVLLIDCNFRHPSLHHLFGFAGNTEGISDILRGSSHHKDVVKNLSDFLLTGNLKLNEEEIRGFDNLRILLSGTRVETPLRLLEAKELSSLFKTLSQTYGLLIVDTNNLRGYADTFNLINSVDALLLVARKGRTTYPLLKDVISRIDKMNGPLKGLIFSNV